MKKSYLFLFKRWLLYAEMFNNSSWDFMKLRFLKFSRWLCQMGSSIKIEMGRIAFLALEFVPEGTQPF